MEFGESNKFKRLCRATLCPSKAFWKKTAVQRQGVWIKYTQFIYLFIGGLQLYNIGFLFGPLSDLVQHDTSVPLEMKTSHSLFEQADVKKKWIPQSVMPGCLQPLKWLTKEIWNKSDTCPTPLMRDWKVLFSPALISKNKTPNPLNISVYFIQREKASTIGMAFQYFPSLICSTNKRKKKSKKGNFGSIGNVGEEGFCSNFSKTFFFFNKKDKYYWY